MPEIKQSDLELWNAAPRKGSLEALQSDVTPITAIKELIDNALDNAQRSDKNNATVKIDIYLDKDEDKLRITDDSGGIREEDMSALFTMGESIENSVKNSIGSYGMGSKKALIHLGEEAEIKSRHSEAEQGYGTTVDEEWLRDENNWDLEPQVYEDIDPGKTVIEIRDLTSHIHYADNLEGELVNDLRDSYELFLAEDSERKGRSMPEIDLNLQVNGQLIEPKEALNWSFTPFDSYHPKRYENIKIDHEDTDQPVTLNLTVGLLKEGDQEEAGTDIYCQKRKVLSAQTETKGGFGRSDHTPGLSTGQWRLKVIIEFEAEKDTDELPWDTQKNDVNRFNPVLQKAYNEWFPDLVNPYIKASYENLPVSFTSNYGVDDEYAENNGVIEIINCAERTDLPKPDTSFSERKRLEQIIDKHKSLGIKCEKIIEKWQKPVYNDYIADKAGLTEINNVPETGIGDFHQKLDEISSKAKEHADEERKLERKDEWWYDFYLEKLDKFYGGDIDELESSDKEESEEENVEEESNKEISAKPEIENIAKNRGISSILDEVDLEDLESLADQAVKQENEKLRERINQLIEDKEAEQKARKEAQKRLKEEEKERKSNIPQMKRAVDKFEKKLKDDDLEGEYQDYIKENPWFFGPGHYKASVEDEVGLFKGVKTDFLIEGINGYSHIVELKRPGAQLFHKRGDKMKIRSDLSKALSQLARYLHECHRKQLLVEADRDHNLMNPKGLLVIGRNREDTVENIKKLNYILDGQIEIITYDNLVAKARSAIEHYEKDKAKNDQ